MMSAQQKTDQNNTATTTTIPRRDLFDGPLATRIKLYPAEMERLVIDQSKISQDLADTRIEMARENNNHLKAILSAKAEDGRPLYPNDRTRDIALTEALASSTIYQAATARESVLEQQKALISGRLERIRAEYRALLIEYEASLLGHR